MQIKCVGDNGIVKQVPSGNKLIGLLLDKEFNIGVGLGTQRALLAQQELYEKGRVRLKKIKVTLEKIDAELQSN
jgi:hypothetical protein